LAFSGTPAGVRIVVVTKLVAARLRRLPPADLRDASGVLSRRNLFARDVTPPASYRIYVTPPRPISAKTLRLLRDTSGVETLLLDDNPGRSYLPRIPANTLPGVVMVFSSRRSSSSRIESSSSRLGSSRYPRDMAAMRRSTPAR